MKTLKLSKKGTPQGDIEIQLAFNGRLIAVKGNNNQYSLQFIQQYRNKGAKVVQRREGTIVDIFANKPGKIFTLGSIEIDLDNDSSEVVENKLCQFYIDTFSKAGFVIE